MKHDKMVSKKVFIINKKALEYGKEVGINMKRATLFILSACFLLSLSACAGSMRSLSKGEIHEVAQGVERGRYNKLEQGQQTVALALEYYDQGGYEKSAGLFLEAADLFRELGARDEERRALIAAAKVQLKCSQRQPFLLTMARFKGLLGRLEMPLEEERFLINLSDHMKGKSLTYPIKGACQVIFKD